MFIRSLFAAGLSRVCYWKVISLFVFSLSRALTRSFSLPLSPSLRIKQPLNLSSSPLLALERRERDDRVVPAEPERVGNARGDLVLLLDVGDRVDAGDLVDRVLLVDRGVDLWFGWCREEERAREGVAGGEKRSEFLCE